MRSNCISPLVGLVLLFSMAAPLVDVQQVRFAAPTGEAEAAATQAMASLATHILATYQADGGQTDPRKLLWVQLAAGRYSQAYTTVSAWRAVNADSESFDDYATLLPFELYARAKLNESSESAGFSEAFSAAFRVVFTALGDTDADAAMAWLIPPPLEDMRARLIQSLDSHRGKDHIEIEDALELCKLYAVLQTYEAISPLTEALIAADDARRHHDELARPGTQTIRPNTY